MSQRLIGTIGGIIVDWLNDHIQAAILQWVIVTIIEVPTNLFGLGKILFSAYEAWSEAQDVMTGFWIVSSTYAVITAVAYMWRRFLENVYHNLFG